MGRQSKSAKDAPSTKILTDDEVCRMVTVITQAMGSEFIEYLEDVGIDAEDSIRMSALAHRCSEARKEREMTIKAAAAQLRCPQYRLKDIEEGRVNHIETALLKRYTEFLGLEEWVDSWVSANPRVASRLGLRASGDADPE